MSFSVDDLVSSFSSNHVGQEALDLVLLQNQLAQTLCKGTTFSGSPRTYNRGHTTILPPHGRGQAGQPCTTPIARTPSLSGNLDWPMAMDMSRSRRNSVSSTFLEDQMDVEMIISIDSLRSHASPPSSAFVDDIEQDERLVEDLLIPSPPSSAPLSGSQFSDTPPCSPLQRSKLLNAGQLHIAYMTGTDMASPSSPTGSVFTSTDPFYIAQLQSLNNASHSQSWFTQHGCLPQNSPFTLPERLHSQGQFDRT